MNLAIILVPAALIINIKYKGDSVYQKGSKSSYIPPAKKTK
jgi:hypothetical protein